MKKPLLNKYFKAAAWRQKVEAVGKTFVSKGHFG
jgi:hypothetical protein